MRSVDAVVTTFDLIRHGEPQGGRKFRGTTDDPLSREGWLQMRQAVGDQAPWDVIITSPLRRCREFANWLGAQHHIPVQEQSDLAELFLGQWEGLTHAEARQSFPAQADKPDGVTAFWVDPLMNPTPQGETLYDFDHRIRGVWKALAETYPGQHLLIVAHLFTCNFLLRQILQQPIEKALFFDLPYAGLTRIRQEETPYGSFSQVEWVGLTRLP